MKKILSTKTIIDFSTHLPGPYACSQLAKMGAHIIKPIPKNSPLPFNSFPPTQTMSIFKTWYHNFNKHKDIIFYQDIQELDELFHQAHGVITNKDNLKLPPQLKVTIIKSGLKDHFPRHDLNVLAESGFLTHYIKLNNPSLQTLAPPSLPWAGIIFAKEIALLHLSQYINDSQKEYISLQEVFNDLIKDFLPQSLKPTPYLHSGAYPCYRLYKLKDQSWIALASIEKKFWHQFITKYQLPFSDEDRFDETGVITKKLIQFFQTITQNDLEASEAFCLSKIKNAPLVF